MDRLEKSKLQELINSGSQRIKFINLESTADWKRKFQFIICDCQQVNGFVACMDCKELIAHVVSRRDWCNSHRDYLRCKERKADIDGSFQRPSLATQNEINSGQWSVINQPNGIMKIKRVRVSQQQDETGNRPIAEEDNDSVASGEQAVSSPESNSDTMEITKNSCTEFNGKKLRHCMKRKSNRCRSLYSGLEDESDNDDWMYTFGERPKRHKLFPRKRCRL